MLTRLMRRVSGSRPRTRKADRRLQVEGLETRSLLSLTPLNFGATVTSTPVSIGNQLLFAANDGSHGTQLWATDGTAAGTAMLTNINSQGNGLLPTDLTAVGNTLYFVANAGQGDQLWKSDGTAAGTGMVTTSNDGAA